MQAYTFAAYILILLIDNRHGAACVSLQHQQCRHVVYRETDVIMLPEHPNSDAAMFIVCCV